VVVTEDSVAVVLDTVFVVLVLVVVAVVSVAVRLVLVCDLLVAVADVAVFVIVVAVVEMLVVVMVVGMHCLQSNGQSRVILAPVTALAQSLNVNEAQRSESSLPLHRRVVEV
jgi:hypothetical protein